MAARYVLVRQLALEAVGRWIQHHWNGSPDPIRGQTEPTQPSQVVAFGPRGNERHTGTRGVLAQRGF
jgi:hypothetical protein